MEWRALGIPRGNAVNAQSLPQTDTHCAHPRPQGRIQGPQPPPRPLTQFCDAGLKFRPVFMGFSLISPPPDKTLDAALDSSMETHPTWLRAGSKWLQHPGLSPHLPPIKERRLGLGLHCVVPRFKTVFTRVQVTPKDEMNPIFCLDFLVWDHIEITAIHVKDAPLVLVLNCRIKRCILHTGEDGTLLHVVSSGIQRPRPGAPLSLKQQALCLESAQVAEKTASAPCVTLQGQRQKSRRKDGVLRLRRTASLTTHGEPKLRKAARMASTPGATLRGRRCVPGVESPTGRDARGAADTEALMALGDFPPQDEDDSRFLTDPA